MKSGEVALPTLAAGEAWVHSHNKFWQTPALILLSGPMGAGKTQLVRWVLAELGCAEASSPTFAIHHRYQLKSRIADHFDLYRLNSLDDLESSGFWDILSEKNNLVFIEWADRLPPESFPKDRPTLWLHFEVRESGERVLRFVVHE